MATGPAGGTGAEVKQQCIRLIDISSGSTETIFTVHCAYPVEVIGKCSDDCRVIRLEWAQNAMRQARRMHLLSRQQSHRSRSALSQACRAESIAKIQLAVKARQAVIVQYVPWSLICSLLTIIKFLLSGSPEEEGFTASRKNKHLLLTAGIGTHNPRLLAAGGAISQQWANQDSQPWSMSQ